MKIDAIDAEKREESKINIKNKKKPQKTPTNTKKRPKMLVNIANQKKLQQQKSPPQIDTNAQIVHPRFLLTVSPDCAPILLKEKILVHPKIQKNTKKQTKIQKNKTAQTSSRINIFQ